MARSTPQSSEPDDAAAARAVRPLPAGSRRCFLGATGVCGVAFGWAALHLPWRLDAPLALLLWALAAANAGTLVALLGSGRHVRAALAVLVALSLVAAPVFSGAIVVSSMAMVRMFGALGWGLTVALAAIGWLLLLGTLPLGLLGLHHLRRAAPDAPHAGA